MRIEVVSRTLDDDEKVVEPVSLDLVKAQIRALSDLEDDLLRQYLATAREYLESYTERMMIEAEVDIFLDSWEVDNDGTVSLPLGGITEVSGVFYRPSDSEAEVEWPAESYRWSPGSPGRITGLNGYPTTSATLEPIRVRVKSGYGTTADSVPAKAKQYILLVVSQFNQFREPVSLSSVSKLPIDHDALARRMKWRWY